MSSKANVINERQANLPLPEEPPVASDWNSADASKVNVGSGAVESGRSTGTGLDEPSTGPSSVRVSGDEFKINTAPNSNTGREGKENLTGLPKDALKH
ncbi:hypothetical protein L228DRAFT_246491 [Xylona heveae TC161]|uniref:Uncharacterized protein n=1 Tax=Xylona heveae (strain CBS 132557 / TC161) TaxID=1328760 RepID=A0A165HKP8_XYLHT|nr:hypothetical protein L228DRAFT_246491 [Xylona heveae TC161]KZF23658.1 hypothetical protein L228DRAFT_246491 [Xylona heveae TC161]